MDVDGSNVVTVAGDPLARSSMAPGRPTASGSSTATRPAGINDDDEIFVARADGSERRNITNDPANDWGPDWSPDGSTIVFNSDRDGGRLRGYLVDPDGSNLRPLDDRRLGRIPVVLARRHADRLRGPRGVDYEIYVADLATAPDRSSPTPRATTAGRPGRRTARRSPSRRSATTAGSRRRTQECWRTGDARRPASRHLAHERRRLEPASRHARDRPVRRLVARRPVPADLGPRPLRRSAGRHRPAGAARGWASTAPSAASRTGADSSD